MTIPENALATTPIEVAVRPSAAAFEPNSMSEAMAMAEVLAKSGLVPKALTSKEAVFYVLVAGRELGFSAVQSLRSLHIIDGKIVMSADLMVAQVHRSGLAEYFSLIESTDKIATYETKRRGAPTAVRMGFSIEQAQRAGLLAKQNWKSHPEAMLRARAASALARAIYPDALQGMYDPEEAEEFRPAPAQVSVVAAAQAISQPAPVPASSAPSTAPIAPEDPAAKWLEKIQKAGEQKKPILACLNVGRQIAEYTSNGLRARCLTAWAEQFEKLARARVTTQEALDAMRGSVIELPEDFRAAGVRVCDAINLDAEPPADASQVEG